MLIGSYAFLRALKDYRVLTIMGRYGGYKTSLAFKLVSELYNDGYIDRAISNCNSVWNENLDSLVIDDPRQANVAIVLDEGGLYLDDRKSVKQVMAFLRKTNIVLIVPSVLPPSLRMQSLTVQMVYSFMGLGLPLVVYRWSLQSGHVREVGYFSWFRPDIYGVYDTLDAPIDANDIIDWLGALKDRFAKGSTSYTNSHASGHAGQKIAIDWGDDLDDVVDKMEALTASINEASYVPPKKSIFSWKRS